MVKAPIRSASPPIDPPPKSAITPTTVSKTSPIATELTCSHSPLDPGPHHTLRSSVMNSTATTAVAIISAIATNAFVPGSGITIVTAWPCCFVASVVLRNRLRYRSRLSLFGYRSLNRSSGTTP